MFVDIHPNTLKLTVIQAKYFWVDFINSLIVQFINIRNILKYNSTLYTSYFLCSSFHIYVPAPTGQFLLSEFLVQLSLDFIFLVTLDIWPPLILCYIFKIHTTEPSICKRGTSDQVKPYMYMRKSREVEYYIELTYKWFQIQTIYKEFDNIKALFQ